MTVLMSVQLMMLKGLEVGVSYKHKVIGFVELRKLDMSGLRLRLRASKNNLVLLNGKSGIGSKGMDKREIGRMIVVTGRNIDMLFGEIERRLQRRRGGLM